MNAEKRTSQEIIDMSLLRAGWQVGDLSQAVEEFVFKVSNDTNYIDEPSVVAHKQFAGYILKDRHRNALAGVEAKKTTHDAQVRRKTFLQVLNLAFVGFISAHSGLSSRQVPFLDILKSYMLEKGEVARKGLIHASFMSLHPNGIRGLFPSYQIDGIIQLTKTLRPDATKRSN